MKGHEIKSVRTAYLLWLVGLFGCLGVHRMYLGKRKTARLWLCTLGVLGIGALADALLLRWLVKRHNRLAEMQELKRHLEDIRQKKQQAVDRHRYKEAASLRDEEVRLVGSIRKMALQLALRPVKDAKVVK